MNDVEDTLREIADDADDFEKAGGSVSMRRRGQQFTFELRTVPTIGVCALFPDGRQEPIETFIQKDLLQLPYLANQICRTLERAAEKRPAPYIDGPSETYTPGGTPHRWDQTLAELTKTIVNPEFGTTHIVELMASAGQGKTVLLEQVATNSVLTYQPGPYPHPIVLPVDLLGRHVGNVDDAIAGSLNNTYASPGLTQADVILCLRHRWLVLALDGFDELVARVGVADAITHIKELVDDLRGSGTILLSARATFFELYEIANGIRRFLNPADGSYTTTVVRLLPWENKQGRELFSAMGSTAPEQELDRLLNIFEADQKIVFHPFFLTRLAVLWKKGDAFQHLPGRSEGLNRAKWVIDTFIEREHQDKWTGKDGRPLLTAEQHAILLAGIAEEMWLTGAFRLNPEELRLAAQMGLADLRLHADVLQQVSERTPTHAALTGNGRQFSFFHDQFLHYALGYRLATYLIQDAFNNVAKLFSPRTLPPDAIEWLDWLFHQGQGDVMKVVTGLNTITSGGFQAAPLYENSSLVLARLLAGRLDGVELAEQRFFGDALSKRTYNKIVFTRCSFWEIDLTGTKMLGCRFESCEFGSMLIDESTDLTGSVFNRCKMRPIRAKDGRSSFTPKDVEDRLRDLGATVELAPEPPKKAHAAISQEVTDCIEYVVRLSERTCDVAVEDVEQRYSDLAADVMKKAQARSIVRRISRPAAGRPKTFFRFQVDRSEFLEGQGRLTGDLSIDQFWSDIATEYPSEE